ncbi:phage tail assembly protein [Pantoea dispersa]|uniref:phage tail assembly protein n=1 Tax=Pantoea dispersa TaxID=59814 RepID=UPI0023A96047|nr:phage tail assembly protein [Pantoea dispersa]WEA05640.1 phage tail assembly protein [Pantoea dispersa]
MRKPVTLVKPIIRKNSEVKEVTVTEAMQHTGSLRGLKLYDVMTSDIDSLIKLLPRVTSPALTEVEVSQLDVRDFAELAKEVADFLAPSSETSTTEAEGA